MSANIVYRRSNGEIVGMPGPSARPMDDSDVAPEFAVITDGADDANTHDHYISAGVVTARPASPCTIDKTSITANGLDTATISSIPVGTTALVTDANGTVAYTVNDGTLEITADEPGQIAITVAAPFPAKALTVTVTAA